MEEGWRAPQQHVSHLCIFFHFERINVMNILNTMCTLFFSSEFRHTVFPEF
ncbi:hypothetical protein MtrunA17_Chr3g0145861 [Medicago truncatula]|uniref:Uncharacterized protein n=1 Tax=Medicago truncatula TaxID=3880 RepID=A0A396J427_MEDTR|nr:hypothetical protein MtrunA17_Chr3g0145861 [Medicago truncatula]